MTDGGRIRRRKQTRLAWGLRLLLPIALLTACDRLPEQRGLYYWGAEVNVLCPCGSRDCFWVRGDVTVLNPLRTFVQKQTSQPYQPVFLTYRGQQLDEPTSGFAANYEGYQEITEVLSNSIALPGDCQPPARQ